MKRGPGCWEHPGSFGSHGYAQATGLDGRSTTAHRVAWLLERGVIERGQVVRHLCSNRSKRCVRPDHLAVGTHVENMDDLARAGHSRRALTAEQVREIRRGERPRRELAREYGVSQRTVQNARNGLTYRYPEARIPPRRRRAK